MLYSQNIAIRVFQGVIRVLLKELDLEFGYKQICTQLCKYIYTRPRPVFATENVVHWMIGSAGLEGTLHIRKAGIYMGYNIDIHIYDNHLLAVCRLGNGQKAKREYVLPVRTARLIARALQF